MYSRIYVLVLSFMRIVGLLRALSPPLFYTFNSAGSLKICTVVPCIHTYFLMYKKIENSEKLT